MSICTKTVTSNQLSHDTIIVLQAKIIVYNIFFIAFCLECCTY